MKKMNILPMFEPIFLQNVSYYILRCGKHMRTKKAKHEIKIASRDITFLALAVF